MKGKKIGKTSFFPPMHMHIQICKFNNLDIIDCVNWIIISCSPSTSFQHMHHQNYDVLLAWAVCKMYYLIGWTWRKLFLAFPFISLSVNWKENPKHKGKDDPHFIFFLKGKGMFVLWFIILILVYWFGRLSILSMLYIKR